MDLGPEDTSKKRLAVETALADLGFGSVMSIDMLNDDGVKTKTHFVMGIRNLAMLTPDYVRRAVACIEDGGFRVVSFSQEPGEATFETYRSVRTKGTVQRAAQRGSDMLFVLEGRIHVVPISASHDLDAPLLTQTGDEIVIWGDVLRDWVPSITKFENRTLKRVLRG